MGIAIPSEDSTATVLVLMMVRFCFVVTDCDVVTVLEEETDVTCTVEALLQLPMVLEEARVVLLPTTLQ